jgi:Outer membrane protein beta-barrel domain
MVRHHARFMGGEWMIGKFAIALTLMILIVLLGAQGFTQETPPAQPAAAPPPAQQPADQSAQPAAQPPAQQPAAQQPGAQQPDTGQEPADEVPISRRRAKPKNYKNWTYDVGLGANIDSGATRSFVREGGGVATAGVTRNANRILGLRADFIFANLPLRDSVLQNAPATGDNNNLYAITLDPIINIPASKTWGGYVLAGPGFYHRHGSLSGDTTVPGSGCNSFWIWWGACEGVSIPIGGDFLKSNVNTWGYDLGAGVTRKMPSGVELYLEIRLMHGKNANITTDVRPITLGVRW